LLTHIATTKSVDRVCGTRISDSELTRNGGGHIACAEIELQSGNSS